MKYLIILICLFSFITCSNSLQEKPSIPVPLKRIIFALGDSYEKVNENIPIRENVDKNKTLNFVNFDHEANDWLLKFTANSTIISFHPFLMTATFDEKESLIRYSIDWGGADIYLKNPKQLQKAIDLISENHIDIRNRFKVPNPLKLPFTEQLQFDNHFEKISITEYSIHYTIAYRGYGFEDKKY